MKTQMAQIGIGIAARALRGLAVAACAVFALGAEADAVRDGKLPPPDSAGPHVCAYRTGVTLKRLVFEKPRRMVAHVVRVDLSASGVSFTGTERDPLWGRPMPDYTNETWLVNTKRETTADFMMRKRSEGKNVEIAVNTSGWRPWGGAGCYSTYAALYRYAASEGMEVSFGKDPERGVFFIVRRDGQVLIRPHVPVSMTNDVTIAVYGNRRILRRGVRTADADPAKAVDVHPRTAFGLSRDRKTFVVLVVDGRQPGYSEGATCADLADLLLREGCADAINMDGGGSTSLVVYDRARNRPRMLNRHANGYVRKTALNLGLVFPPLRDDQPEITSGMLPVWKCGQFQ